METSRTRRLRGLASESRRSFLTVSRDVAALSVTALTFNPFESSQRFARASAGNDAGLNSQRKTLLEQRLSYRSMQGVRESIIGPVSARKIEGTIPVDLQGTLTRIGPGTRESFGTKLNHFFDGDAFVSRFSFSRGACSIHGKFVETAERAKEQLAQKMLFHEFGTTSPTAGFFAGYKNPPNVNVVNFGSMLFALSESTHPVLVEPKSLDTLGLHNFDSSLSDDVTFCAHPKRDPNNGDFYFFGFSKSLVARIIVYRVPAGASTAQEIGRIPMGGFYMVHDMALTENHVVILIPPVRVELTGALLSSSRLTDSLVFENDKNMRAVIFRKDGSAAPIVLTDLPNALAFHHVNAFEDRSGRITLNTILYDGPSVLDLFQKWQQPNLPEVSSSRLVQFKFDLQQRRVVSQRFLTNESRLDFPCIDSTLQGKEIESAYFSAAPTGSLDLLSSPAIVKLNMQTGLASRSEAEPGRTLGETVFVPSRSGEGWLLNMGYDLSEDETYIDVRNAKSLSLQARVWSGHYIPLGFHGSFASISS